MRTYKPLAWILGALLIGVGLILLAGAMLPASHVVSRTATFPHTPERVFAVLVDIENSRHWRRDVRAVEVLAWEPRVRWREYGRRRSVVFERVEVEPPVRLVTQIADPDQPFGGRWKYELSPDNGGTRLSITEEGEIHNPMVRAFSRYVFGHAATIERFLEDLEGRLGGV